MYDIFIYLRPTFTKNVGNYIPYMDPMGVATFITKDEKQRGFLFNCWWNSFGTNKIHPKHHPNESINIYSIPIPHGGGEIHGENIIPMGFVSP